MKHIAAALLLSLAGKEINEKGINEIMASVGAKADPKVVTLVVNACKGKKTDQLIADGIPKLATAVAVAAGPATAAPVEKGKDEKKGKKEEKKKEPEPEPEEDIGFGDLF